MEYIILNILFKFKFINENYVYIFNVTLLQPRVNDYYLYDFTWYGGTIKCEKDMNTNFARLRQLLKNVYTK